jgi:hypothetical protein
MDTRIRWFILDGPARVKGSDTTPRRVSKERAEDLLDAAASRTNPDKETLPNFVKAYEGCMEPRDWGIFEVEPL